MVQVASAHTDYSGTFIPEVWSSKLAAKFYEATVFGSIANTDWEGEVSDQGDKVHIRKRPDVDIKDYERGTELDIDRPEGETVELTLDYGKYFNVLVEDVDAVQSNIDMLNEFAEDASSKMQVQVDKDVLSGIPGEEASENQGDSAGKESENINLGTDDSPREVTTDDIIDFLVECGTVLDEQSIPQEDRWIILPPAVVGRIKKSDLKDASLAGDTTSILRNGRVGQIDRFTVYSSNNLEKESGSPDYWNVIFGHTQCLTFASQITKTERLKSERHFGEFIRGLNVFGYKVTNPEGIGLARVALG